MCLRSFQSDGFSQQLTLISPGNSVLLLFTEKHVFVVGGRQQNLFYLLTPWAQLKLMEMSLVLIESESKPNYESEIGV